eukprot:CAMPEP_0202000074 /NCGR_PEP_ID=MMETSP0905-20130828/6486_1 /ASSEMBLY_ACC=CAM_ASM_000554 /TAXON_ID=420261 /ORGANISM="Thalassiosira antarctica, Strain CCMP982" /LENGTH=203 /DNA_ID=CAMNT_0048556439 /DNA_START=74 /DNA_END=686 /DNA_ORIENTATION=-
MRVTNEATHSLRQVLGIPRSGQTYIDLQCIITVYPHRDKYMSSTLLAKDVREHISQGVGMNIELCDYPSNKTTLLKWGEVHAIQLFVEHQRGDSRPSIIFKERMQQHLHCDEITNKFEEVQGGGHPNSGVGEKKELAADEKRLSIIYDAVAFYKKKMAAVIAKLDEVLSRRRATVECEPLEIELDNAISIFDKDKYTNGEYNV